MYCCLHLSSIYSHVSASVELQIGHVLDGKASFPKKSCLRAWPIYCPVRNFIEHVLCLSVMAGFVQKSFDSFYLCHHFLAVCVIGAFDLLSWLSYVHCHA